MKIDVKDSVYENVDKIYKAKNRDHSKFTVNKVLQCQVPTTAKHFLTSGLTVR
jgi:hypothetical protein